MKTLIKKSALAIIWVISTYTTYAGETDINPASTLASPSSQARFPAPWGGVSEHHWDNKWIEDSLRLAARNFNHLITTHYALDIEIDYSEKVVLGNCMMTIENISDEEILTIPLLLYKLFNILSVKDTLDNRLAHSQEVVALIDWPEFKVNYIEVTLPEPLLPEQGYTLAIDYAGPLQGNTEAARYLHDRISKDFTIIRSDCNAYPEIGIPVDSVMMARGIRPTFNYTINVTVPKGMTASNPGKLDSILHTEYKTTYRFSNIITAWRMDICIADYSILEYSDLNLRIHYFPDDTAGANNIAEHYENAVNCYTRLYGKISEPAHFTIIEVPTEYGSQSDVNGTLLQAKNFEPNSDFLGLYHELSHQWDPVETGSLNVRWSEGLADFHQYYLQRELDGKKDALKAGFENARYWFKHALQNNPEYKEIPFSEHGVHGVTDLSYLKGMMFFTVFYHYVGEELFFQMMRSYYQTYFVQGASLEDFVSHLESYTDPGAKQLITDWIYDTRSNEYIIGDLSPEDIVALYRK